MHRLERLLATVGLFFILTVLPLVTFAENLPPGQESSSRTLTLQDAIRRIKESPTLKAAAQNVDIQENLLEQAGLLPNPDIAFEVENFGGKDELDGFESAEATIAVSQLLELGGKRSARSSIASHEKSLAERDFEIENQNLLLETMEAFYALLAAQERFNQAKQLLGLAEQTYKTVDDRVKAGKVSPIQELQASVELNLVRNAWEVSQRQLIQAKQSLSSLWGAPKPDFDVVVGDFENLHEPPTWEELQVLFPDNPELKRWDVELASKKANLELERANGVSDLTLSFGVKNFQETNDYAFVAGLEFPIPLFDRNQCSKKAAQSEVYQSTYQRDAAIAKLESNLQSAYQELLATFHQARTIKQDIMPAAEKANEAARTGYQEGKFDFLVALDAQRTLFEVKGQFIDAFSAYHEARLNVMRLVGSTILTQPSARFTNAD